MNLHKNCINLYDKIIQISLLALIVLVLFSPKQVRAGCVQQDEGLCGAIAGGAVGNKDMLNSNYEDSCLKGLSCVLGFIGPNVNPILANSIDLTSQNSSGQFPTLGELKEAGQLTNLAAVVFRHSSQLSTENQVARAYMNFMPEDYVDSWDTEDPRLQKQVKALIKLQPGELLPEVSEEDYKKSLIALPANKLFERFGQQEAEYFISELTVAYIDKTVTPLKLVMTDEEDDSLPPALINPENYIVFIPVTLLTAKERCSDSTTVVLSKTVSGFPEYCDVKKETTGTSQGGFVGSK